MIMADVNGSRLPADLRLKSVGLPS